MLFRSARKNNVQPSPIPRVAAAHSNEITVLKDEVKELTNQIMQLKLQMAITESVPQVPEESSIESSNVATLSNPSQCVPIDTTTTNKLNANAPASISYPPTVPAPKKKQLLPTATTKPPGSETTIPCMYDPAQKRIVLVPDIKEPLKLSSYGVHQVTIYSPDKKSIVSSAKIDVTPDPNLRLPLKFEIKDSLNNVLSGVSVELVTKDGRVIKKGKTDANGFFPIPQPLPDDVYTFAIDGGSNLSSQSYSFVLYNQLVNTNTAPTFVKRFLQAGAVEIVLAWGQNPRDLDSHMFVDDGRHISYRKKTESNLSLDCDVTNGYGPETVQVTLEPGRKYVYAVHLYAGEGTLPSSNASVTMNNQVFQIPKVSGNPRWWFVFGINGSTKELTAFNSFEQGDLTDCPSEYYGRIK